jgi:hypothetical protein
MTNVDLVDNVEGNFLPHRSRLATMTVSESNLNPSRVTFDRIDESLL